MLYVTLHDIYFMIRRLYHHLITFMYFAQIKLHCPWTTTSVSLYLCLLFCFVCFNFFFIRCYVSVKSYSICFYLAYFTYHLSSAQFSSVTQSCPAVCDPMNRSTPDLPVYHQLPEFTQTHNHQVSDAIQPSHPLLSPSPPAPNRSQHQRLFQ